MKATTQALRLVAAIALAFAALTATAAAKKLEVKVTGSRHDGIQYWVKYTINGVEYRSDQAAERVNQIAWGAMSHEDRLKTMEAVYSVGNARKAQFGEGFAANMTFWYNEVKGWNEAKEILVDRLVEKDYPGLTSRFGDNFQSYCAEYFSAEHEADRYKFTELLRILAERDLALAWAQEAYKALCNAEYARTAAAVKSTSGDLIQLICDKCLVPSISLTSAGGIGILSASDSWLGIILDYSNSLLHIQDNLTDYIVGERATAKAASKVIARETEAIALNYKIIQECTKRAHELVTEFDSRYAALDAAEKEELAKIREEEKRESSARATADLEKSASVVNRLDELQSAIDSADRALSQAYAALEAARKAGSDADTLNRLSRAVNEKDKALTNAKASKVSYIEEVRTSIETRVATWEKNWKGIYAGFQKESNDLYDTQPILLVDQDRFNEIINGKAYGEHYSSATEGEVATMIADIEKWLADKEEHDKKQQDTIDRFAEQERIAYWGWIPMKMDANAIDLRLDFHWPDPAHGYFPFPTNTNTDRPSGWSATAAQVELLKNWSKVQDACLAQEKRLGESADAVATLAENAIRNFTSASDALESFAMPDFVKEQEIGGGILVVDVNSELGRAFLADDATGTAETAAGYRNRLNELADSYEEQFVRCGMLRDSVSTIGRALRSAYVSGHLTNTNKSYSAIIGRFERSGQDVIKSSAHIGKLKALQRDFNNRSYAHDREMDVFESLNNRRDEFSTNIIAHYSETIIEYSSLTEAAKDPYLVTAITGHGFGRDSNHWSNPYWALWPGTFEFATASMQYSRGMGSYAYYAKDYYKKYFGDEPDPYEDLVKPLIAEMDAARAAYERQGVMPVDYDPEEGEYGGGTVEPGDAPTLFDAGKAETAFMGDATYNGWVRNADGSLAGLLTVKAAKPAKPERGGQSKLTITYTPFGGKKQTIKLANDAMPVAGGVATVAIPGVGTVKFTGDALVGVGVDVQAGKDMLKSRDRGEKAAATAAAASKAGVWTFALGTDAGFAAFSVTVDKKGKGKLAGTFPDGTKVSVSAQGVLGDGVLAIPFTYAKKGTLGFVFWVKGDGTAALSDLTGDVGGSLGTARPTIVAPSASHRLSDGDHVFTAGDVSQAFTVAGKKWNVPKQNKRAEVDPNPTGLKLAFTEKTGVVKGMFTVVDGKAKTKYTVVGAVVGGKFYGSAYVRNAVPIPATAE